MRRRDSGASVSVQPPSCTSRWWNEQSRTRLSRSVRPPRLHHRTWWACVNRRFSQPGNRHSRSRWRSWRIIGADGTRVSRPRRSGSPLAVFGHDLDPAVAREPPGGLRRDHRAVLDLGVPLGAREGLERCVHHDRGAVGIGVARDPGRAERHERVGPSGVDALETFLSRHRRHRVGQAGQRLRDEHALIGGQLRLEPEPGALVFVPPAQRPGAFGVDGLGTLSLPLEVGLATDRAAGDARWPIGSATPPSPPWRTGPARRPCRGTGGRSRAPPRSEEAPPARARPRSTAPPSTPRRRSASRPSGPCHGRRRPPRRPRGRSRPATARSARCDRPDGNVQRVGLGDEDRVSSNDSSIGDLVHTFEAMRAAPRFCDARHVCRGGFSSTRSSGLRRRPRSSRVLDAEHGIEDRLVREPGREPAVTAFGDQIELDLADRAVELQRRGRCHAPPEPPRPP